MVRHIFVTVLIFFAVYVGLLITIDHPVLGQSSTKQELTPPKEVVTQSEHETTRAIPAKVVPTKQAAEKTRNSPVFNGLTLVGVSAVVPLANAHQEINQVWQQLLAKQSLINQVDWAKGKVSAFAYYREFDSNMTKARLTVGFALKDLKGKSHLDPIFLPTGHYKAFSMDPSTGAGSEAAWAAAYSHKNLIERHILNSNGKPISADAIVILK